MQRDAVKSMLLAFDWHLNTLATTTTTIPRNTYNNKTENPREIAEHLATHQQQKSPERGRGGSFGE